MKNLIKMILITTLLITLFLITTSTVNASDIHMNSTNNTIANAVTNQTTDGDTIYLNEGTYNNSHLNGTDGININKNLTIIGKGENKTIIDAEKIGRIFSIQPNRTFTLINLTLTNGNTSDRGGAIYNNQGNLIVINCKFIDNIAIFWGGAIYNSASNLFINNSRFINNIAAHGGAIRLESGNNNILNNSVFINNIGKSGSGAISNMARNGIIYNCNFTNNTAEGNYGGAITNLNNGDCLTLINSNFINNTVINANGGAIYAYSSFTLINCSFINNNATNGNGGAIYSYPNVIMDIFNSSFINNTASIVGGAIINFGKSIVCNSTFINNTANEIGGAITNLNNGVVDLFNSSFISNNAIHGGAIFNNGTGMSLIGCDIINNSKAIYINSTNTTINYNRIFNNTNYDLNNSATDTNADYNWWGNNTPTKITGIIPNNYFVMDVTNLTSLDSNGTVTFNYIFHLNDNSDSNISLLPYFVTDIYTNLITGVIKSIDARFNRTFDVILNTSGNILYTFITDNEIQKLEGKIVIPPKPEPSKPDPEPPSPIPKPDNNSTKLPDSNKTNNNPTTVSATMKSTGIPINLIIILCLSVLAVLSGRKQN